MARPRVDRPMCRARRRRTVRPHARRHPDDAMLLATFYLDRCATRLRAYNMLQLRLMETFIRRGGSADAWCVRYAPAFRRRFGWMLVQR